MLAGMRDGYLLATGSLYDVGAAIGLHQLAIALMQSLGNWWAQDANLPH